VSSYTKTEIEKIIDVYSDNPCLEVVDKLSVMFNRPRKSIISKLVKEGVYIKRGYVTKTGETPITKLELVRGIEENLDTKLPGLDKAPKTTLKLLHESIEESSHILEDIVSELHIEKEVNAARLEMLSKHR